VVSDVRQLVPWSAPTNPGTFGFTTGVVFTGAPGAAIFTAAIYDSQTGGTLGGLFDLSGDDVFSAEGTFTLSTLSLVGSAE
jgi:hypothetical protein